MINERQQKIVMEAWAAGMQAMFEVLGDDFTDENFYYIVLNIAVPLITNFDRATPSEMATHRDEFLHAVKVSTDIKMMQLKNQARS